MAGLPAGLRSQVLAALGDGSMTRTRFLSLLHEACGTTRLTDLGARTLEEVVAAHPDVFAGLTFTAGWVHGPDGAVTSATQPWSVESRVPRAVRPLYAALVARTPAAAPTIAALAAASGTTRANVSQVTSPQRHGEWFSLTGRPATVAPSEQGWREFVAQRQGHRCLGCQTPLALDGPWSLVDLRQASGMALLQLGTCGACAALVAAGGLGRLQGSLERHGRDRFREALEWWLGRPVEPAILAPAAITSPTSLASVDAHTLDSSVPALPTGPVGEGDPAASPDALDAEAGVPEPAHSGSDEVSAPSAAVAPNGLEVAGRLLSTLQAELGVLGWSAADLDLAVLPGGGLALRLQAVPPSDA